MLKPLGPAATAAAHARSMLRIMRGMLLFLRRMLLFLRRMLLFLRRILRFRYEIGRFSWIVHTRRVTKITSAGRFRSWTMSATARTPRYTCW